MTDQEKKDQETREESTAQPETPADDRAEKTVTPPPAGEPAPVSDEEAGSKEPVPGKEEQEPEPEPEPEPEIQVLEADTGEIYDPNSEFNWYFIQVLSGNEQKVATLIKELIKSQGKEEEITNVVVPMVEKPKKLKSGERKLVMKKLYPGYILLRLRMSDENWNMIRNVNNVIDFVGGRYNPTPISRQEWEEIFLGKKKKKREELMVKYTVNEKVKINDGPFANFFGDIAEINEEKRHVKVMISIFGRLTPVELAFDEIEKI